MSYVYVKNRFVPRADAVISVQERGFRFGDGLFETIRLIQGVPYQWDLHMARLNEGLKQLNIAFDTKNLHSITNELIVKNRASEGFLRLSVSRGIGSRGFLPMEETIPTLVVETLLPVESTPETSSLWLSSWQKPDKKALPVHIKTMQGLNSTLARIEAQENQCIEALLLGGDNHICEGSSSNIFWVKDEILYTPSIDCGVLAGTIREAILRQDIFPVKQGFYSLEDLKTADEVFITNVAWLILPIAALQPQNWRWEKTHAANALKLWLKKDMQVYAATYNL